MELRTRDDAVIFHTYKRLPLAITRGEGMYLYDAAGNRYLDMFAGIAVNALGYAHPDLLRAINAQAAAYVHLSNYFAQEPQIRLAEQITRASGYERVFFCNSGTEATEGAMKLARRWGSSLGRTELLSFSNAFHGRSYGALSLMDRPKYRDGFGPFLDHCRLLPFNDVDALRSAVGPATAAVALEFIQGEGGIRPVTPAFAAALEELRARFGFLLIADEVQSGVGRTGKFFGFQHFDGHPDIVTMAKPIGGGLPLGAVLAQQSLASVLEPGTHGTTFGGNPVACAAGSVVLEHVVERGLMKNAETLGVFLKDQLQQLATQFPVLVKEVRGYGLMVGMELHHEGESIVSAMREKGVLINCTDNTVLRIVPPLIVAREHVETTVNTLREVLAQSATGS
jgi:acetylornithine/N-succinyldiaminopimelate aminotransferase